MRQCKKRHIGLFTQSRWAKLRKCNTVQNRAKQYKRREGHDEIIMSPFSAFETDVARSRFHVLLCIKREISSSELRYSAQSYPFSFKIFCAFIRNIHFCVQDQDLHCKWMKTEILTYTLIWHLRLNVAGSVIHIEINTSQKRCKWWKYWILVWRILKNEQKTTTSRKKYEEQTELVN